MIAFSTARLRITTLVEDRGWYGSVDAGDVLTHSGFSVGSRCAGPDHDRYGWVAVDEADHVLVGMEVV